MLKTCKYCGRIHQEGYECPKKPERKGPLNTKAQRFRKNSVWTKMSLYIRRRDRGLCQACLNKMPGTERQYEYQDVSVHHIVPVEEDYDLRMDEENLISLCRYHHEAAEKGEISRELLSKWARDSQRRFEGEG